MIFCSGVFVMIHQVNFYSSCNHNLLQIEAVQKPELKLYKTRTSAKHQSGLKYRSSTRRPLSFVFPPPECCSLSPHLLKIHVLSSHPPAIYT